MSFESIMRVSGEVFERLIQAMEPVFGTMEYFLVGRLALVLLLCGMIGLERSEHERASGFRPHILVGLGACLMTMAGAYALPGDTLRDPMRVASYVVSGIGFLGAGAILRHGTTVRGLTTAASIWGSAGIGITAGVGMGGLATAATLFILFTLTTLERLESWLGRGETANDLKLHLKDDHRAVGKALTALDRLGIAVRRATMMPSANDSAILRVELCRPLKAEQVPRIVKQLTSVNAILRVDVTALEVEEAEDLRRGALQNAKECETLLERSRIDDGTLLRDLNEPDEQSEKNPS